MPGIPKDCYLLQKLIFSAFIRNLGGSGQMTPRGRWGPETTIHLKQRQALQMCITSGCLYNRPRESIATTKKLVYDKGELEDV